MKKNIVAGLFFSLLFANCTTNDFSDGDDSEILQDSMICCQASMSVTETSKHANDAVSEGRGGEINSTYPCDYIYFIANVREYMQKMQSTFNKIESSEKEVDDDIEDFLNKNYVLKIPVVKWGNIRYFDLCFSRPNPYGEQVYAISNGKRVKFNLWQECIFSSTASGVGTLEFDYKTQGEKSVFEPYDDKLFYSNVCQLRDSNGNLNISFQGENGNSHDIKNNGRFPINMHRATALVKSGLLITDMSMTKPNLKKQEFERVLGNIGNWECSSIIKNTSIVYTVRNFMNASYSLKQIFNVSLFKEEKFQENIRHNTKNTEYKGIGYIDNDGEFIFPIPSGKVHMYYTFQYDSVDDDDDKRKSYATLHVKMDGLPGAIGRNTNWEITTVIDYIDLQKAIEGEYGKASKTSIPFRDGFGPMIEVPYELLINRL